MNAGGAAPRLYRSLAAAAAAMVLATSCGPVELDLGSDPTTGSAAITAAPTPSTSTPRATTPPPRPIVIEPVFGGEVSGATAEWVDGTMPEQSEMRTVTATGTGFVAAGVERPAGSETTDAAIWTSPEGTSWERMSSADLGDAASGHGSASNQAVNDIANSALGVVAVGVDWIIGDSDAAVWHSTDGMEWRRVAHDPGIMGGDGDQAAHAVVVTDSLAIAVGEAGGAAVVWISDDGLTWRLGDVQDDSPGGGNDPAVMRDVAVTPTGFVAVGGAGLDERPAVWLSSDGVGWHRLLDEMAGGASGFDLPLQPMTSVAAGEAGIVAIGDQLRIDEDPSLAERGTKGPAVWVSADGFEWRLVEPSFLERTDDPSSYAYVKRGSPVVLADVTWVGSELIAVGGYELEPTAYSLPSFVTLWSSSDGGETWRVADEATLRPTETPRGAWAITVADATVILVGNDDIPAGDHPEYGWPTWAATPAVWLARLPGG
jgi:hypothetical protein